ncbi:hypothetical protein ACIBCL_17525 [Micromonospora zamorensis]|uniref:hypothetical protein n=1 Tax=Micromonospora zamorensis TaxID=709883 RepID=UPI0037AEA9F8
MQVIAAARPAWIFPSTGLQPAQFCQLVRLVAERGGDVVKLQALWIRPPRRQCVV